MDALTLDANYVRRSDAELIGKVPELVAKQKMPGPSAKLGTAPPGATSKTDARSSDGVRDVEAVLEIQSAVPKSLNGVCGITRAWLAARWRVG